MIKLNQLLKEETFTATNKATGKTSVFKTKDSRDAAIKAGTHDPIKDKEQPSAPKAAGSDMFGGDYAKDRGIEAPKADAGKEETPKYNLGVDSVVYNKRTNTIGIVRMSDERGETKTDADGNVNTDELEPYNPMKYPHQKDAKVAPSTSKEIESRKLFNPFSQKNDPINEPKKSAEKADNVIKALKPTQYGGKHPDSMESGGSLYRINKKGQAVRDREVRLKDITPDDISNTEKLFDVDLSKGIENGLDYETNSLIIQYKRLQQFDKGGEFENKEAYDSLLKNVKSWSSKDYKKAIDKAEKNKQKQPNVSILKTDKDGDVSFDSAMSIEKLLNKELGEDGGADVNSNGAIEYTIANEDGDWDNALYIGKQNGKWVVSIESNGGTDNKKFGDDEYKTFDKPKDAINHAIMIAKKYKKELGGKTANEGVIRLTKLMENDPCWKGYKQVGMKDKNGREVPNCVPEGVIKEGGYVPKMYKAFSALSLQVRKLEDEQLKLRDKYFAEKELNRKNTLMQQLKKGTEELKKWRDRLSKVENEYIMNLDKDAEYYGES